MIRSWTFGRKIAASFVVMVSRLLFEAQSFNASVAQKSSAARGYLLTGDQSYITQMTTALRAFTTELTTAEGSVHTAAERQKLATIGRDQSAHQQAILAVIALRQSGVSVSVVPSPSSWIQRSQPSSAPSRSCSPTRGRRRPTPLLWPSL